jgi:putative membrane-bound dehydrogenase-like protein
VRTYFALWAAAIVLAGCSSKSQSSDPPYSLRQALDTFTLAEGFRIELAAFEPQVADPVAIAWDENGRMFAVEMPDYPLNPQPKGRVKLLEDADGDGVYERAAVFAEDLHMPTGVMAWKKGILVTCAPEILYFEDTDGDGRADRRQVILTGFAAANPQLRVNGPQYALDNWIYAAYPRPPVPRRYVKEFGDPGSPIRYPDHPEVKPLDIHARDLRFRPDRRLLEAGSGNSQFGNAFDDWNNRYTVWNSDHIRHVVLPPETFDRNPYLSIPNAMQSASDHQNAATVYPTTKDPIYIHDSQVGHFTSACGLSVYTGGSFPEPYQNGSFTCEPVHNLVHCDRLTALGATFTASRIHEKTEFLTSSDSWFRPVYSATGPDGALYIVDYHRYTVEHPEFVPSELLKQLDLEPRQQLGRIYRVSYQGSPKTPKPSLGSATPQQLVQFLSHRNRWWRITAQRLLVDRQDKAAVPELERLAAGESPLGRIHALWTLEGLASLTDDVLLRALGDKHPGVREQAVALAAMRPEKAVLQARIAALASDAEIRVQFRVLEAMARWTPRQNEAPLQKLALARIEDPWFQWVALSAAGENASRWHRAMMPGLIAKQSKSREEFIERLGSIIGARNRDNEIAAVLASVRASSAPAAAWWRRASLAGLAAGRKTSEKQANSSATQAALPGLLLDPSIPVSRAALSLASTFRWQTAALKPTLGKAARVAEDSSGEMERRAIAVGILGLDASPAQGAVLVGYLKPEYPDAIRAAAAAGLSGRDDRTSINALLDHWRSLTPSVRDAALGVFFQESGRLRQLLEAVKDGKVQPWSLGPARTRQLLRSTDPEIKKMAQSVLGEVEADRQKIFEKYLPSLTAKGDPGKGKQVFGKACLDCHVLEGQGHAVGPDLLSVTTQHKEALLASILIPNQAIETGYEEYLVETKDGRSVTGLLAKDSPAAITLRRAKGEEDVVLRANIASIRSLNVSPMPNDLEQNMSVADMADLISYLKNVK